MPRLVHRARNVDAPTEPRHAAKEASPPGRRSRCYPGAGLYEVAGGKPRELEPDLDLHIDDVGVRVSRDGSIAVWTSSWADISALVVTDDRHLPDGRRGISVVVTTDDGQLRLIAVPSRRPGAVAAKTRASARRHRADPERPDRRLPLVAVAAVVAATSAVVTWLLLVAGHVVSR